MLFDSSAVTELLNELDNMMGIFRPAFSNVRTYYNFLEILLGFIIRPDNAGITSFSRVMNKLRGDDFSILYERHQKFFRSKAIDYEMLKRLWIKFILTSPYTVNTELDGRQLAIGDGVIASKTGSYMPGVIRLHQTSESMTKPTIVWGHMLGSVGVLIGNAEQSFYCPANTDIEMGDAVIRAMDDENFVPESHVIQMLNQIVTLYREGNKSMFAILDRFFLSKNALKIIIDINEEITDCNLALITKAKKNIKVYEKAAVVEHRSKGRPPIKGNAIKLASLFSERADDFQTLEVEIYGKKEKVKYLCVDYLWGYSLYYEMRFVLVTMPNGVQSILVCSDTSVSPRTIIEGYSRRWKCEQSFKQGKHAVGVFDNHFWTFSMPKINHFKKKTDKDPLLSITNERDKEKIYMTLRASEIFYLIGAISQGILQLLSLKARELGMKTLRQLRTYSNKTSSEETMQYDLQLLFSSVLNFAELPPNLQKIMRRAA